MDAGEIRNTVRNFIVNEFLPGEDPAAITDSMELITEGILDSLATLKLVSFVEDRYRVTFKPHETGLEYLNTLDDIAKLVMEKKQGS